MRKQVNGKRAFWEITLFVSAVLLLAVTFHACQQDEMIVEPEEIGLKIGLIPEIILDYPEGNVAPGADFNITYSSSCGRIMIERAFIKQKNTKVYGGLGCDMANLLWEPVGANVYADCQGETITQNLAEPGTYVYRTKLNFKGNKDIGCPDCTFAGNMYECFMITVAAASFETFTDVRDGREYKTITLGTQTWMAENLAYKTLYNGNAYNDDETNVATYGRLYTWNTALTACPAGWHLPSVAEWNTLVTYLTDHGYGYGGSGDEIAKALASTTGWSLSSNIGVPGNDPASNNSSGFNALPGGLYEWGVSRYLGKAAYFWTADEYTSYNGYSQDLWTNYSRLTQQGLSKMFGFSVRCVKD